MPAMLKRSYQQIEEPNMVLAARRESSSTPRSSLKRPFDQLDDVKDARRTLSEEPPTKRQMMNGDATPTPATNGLLTNGYHHEATPGAMEKVQEVIEEVPLPPSIPLMDQGNIPLSILWERLSQEAHVELEELIADLSTLNATQINGYTNERNAANIDKKNKIWDYAHKWRAKFIKLGVLTAWSTNAAAVNKLIAINHWLVMARFQNNDQIQWLGELKRQLSASIIRAPDLKTSLEVLSTGKADWVSSMGYTKQKPASPTELLKSLKTMNTILSIRLTTQEALPPQFSSFTVKSGRVTFHVKDEFDLDLAVASEDSTSQFFFIDLRFRFSPGSKTSITGPMRMHLEARINTILLHEGLQACYDYLHEVILEHKLTMLRNQARKLSRGAWRDNIRLTPASRGVVIHYWMHRPGKKNWLEISINSGKAAADPTTGLVTPQLALRVHRHGKEVLNHGIELDLAHLSLDRILNEVTARHTNYIFKSTKKQLKSFKIFSNGNLSVKHRAHDFDSRYTSLTVQLSSKKTAIFKQDAITGLFSCEPSSSMTWNAVAMWNSLRDPAVEAARMIGIFRCNVVLHDAAFEARKAGWMMTPAERLNEETRVRLFKSAHIKWHFFEVPQWSGARVLMAISTSLDGDATWLIELQAKNYQPSQEDLLTGRASKFRQSMQIKLQQEGFPLLELTESKVQELEVQAASMLSEGMDRRWLKEVAQDHKKASILRKDSRTGVPQSLIRYPIKKLQNHAALDGNWCKKQIRVSYKGLSHSKSAFISWYTGHLRHSNEHLQAATMERRNSLRYNAQQNMFLFQVASKIGTPGLQAADAKLTRLGSLIQFLDATQQFGFVCKEISHDRMIFAYSSLNPWSGEEDSFAAGILFSESKLRIRFSKDNPHLIMKDSLNAELNKPDGMNKVAAILSSTLPLVHAVRSCIKKRKAQESKFHMQTLSKSLTCCRMVYHNQTVKLEFDLELRIKGSLKVHIHSATASLMPGVAAPKKIEQAIGGDGTADTAEAAQPLLPEDLMKSWAMVVRTRKPEANGQWHNLGRGLLCEMSAIGKCVHFLDDEINELFSKAADPKPEMLSSAAKVESVGDEVPTTTSPKQEKATETQAQANSAQAGPKAAPSTTSQALSAKDAQQPAVPMAKAQSQQQAQPMARAVSKQQAPPMAKSTTQQNQSMGRVTSQQAPPLAKTPSMQPNQTMVRGLSQQQPGQARPNQGAPQANMQARAAPAPMQQNRAGYKPPGQQTPAQNPGFQAQQQQRANFTAPQANMAPSRPGNAPQANMMQNRRPQQPNIPQAKQPQNNGQNKNQPITLE